MSGEKMTNPDLELASIRSREAPRTQWTLACTLLAYVLLRHVTFTAIIFIAVPTSQFDHALLAQNLWLATICIFLGIHTVDARLLHTHAWDIRRGILDCPLGLGYSPLRACNICLESRSCHKNRKRSRNIDCLIPCPGSTCRAHCTARDRLGEP